MICKAKQESSDQTSRPVCPFYGFQYTHEVFIDTKGNQCAILTNEIYPCQMESSGREVVWKNCDLNTHTKQSEIEQLLDTTTVFLEELSQGVSLRKWYNHIINQEQI